MRLAVAVLAAVSFSCTTAGRILVDDLFSEYRGPVPGASVLVVRDGEVLLRQGCGLADVEHATSATPSTHYRLASVTKQFTAAAIVTLAGQGRLSLDDPIRRHLPSLPAWADAMTVRHLLTHTSGVVDYEDIMPSDLAGQLKDADVLRLLENERTVLFAPGASYRYSNTGYAFLALIVERVSGQTFASFLRDQVFAPAGMRTTVAHEEGITTVPHRAYGHSREGASWKRTDQSSTSAVLGDGGIYTSIDELVHWLAALDKGRFAIAMEPRVATDDPNVRYGFGWRISQHDGHRTVGHTGETIGFRNALVRFPDERLAVVVLTNRNEGEPMKIALAVADRFLKR